MRFCGAAALILAGQMMTAEEQSPARVGSPSVYSPEKEAAIGTQMASELRQHTTVIDSSSVTGYISRIGRRISAQMPKPAPAFVFSAIADDPCPATHEPGSLPGGYVFVPAALIVGADDEAEFAGMLAHSMEHIAQHHATRQAASGQLANYGSIPLVFLGSWSGCPGALAVPMQFWASQRHNEMEADALAVEATARAGFDPQGLGRYIGRVQPERQTKVSSIFSALPGRPERLAALVSLAKQQPALDYQVTSAEFVAVQREVASLAGSRDRPVPTLLPR
jgi:predicted Zn-dependent protease